MDASGEPEGRLMRVGVGYDLHRLAAGRPLMLGGVRLPFDRGLVSHSDGDVLLHAVIDALLGAAGLPDIGELFPDTDPALAGADSGELTAQVARRVREAGWVVVNLDAVVVAEAPRLSPHKPAIRRRIAELLGIDAARVNVKGKTAEGVGDIGAGGAIAAHAVALLRRWEPLPRAGGG
jgi:2-C-methyl-D-erythritol 2,4-cyclodiphosphate synthase